MTTECEHPPDNRCPLCSDKLADRYKCTKHGISKYRCTECPNNKVKTEETCGHPPDKCCRLCSDKPADRYKCTKHGIRKYNCLECGGSARCRHSNYRNRCKLCKEFVSIV